MPGADTAVLAQQNEGNSSDSSGSGSVAPSDRRKTSKHRQTQSREVLQRASPAPATSAGASNERSAARGFVYDPSMPIPVEWQMLAYQNQQKKKTGSDGKTGTEGMSVLSGQWPPSVPGSGPKDQPHHHHRHHSQRSHTGSDSARHQVKQELDPMTHHNKHHSSSNSHSRYAHETGTHRNTHGGHSHRDTYPMDYIEHRHEGKQGSATYGSDVAPHISTLASSSSSPSTHVVSSTKTASLPVAPLSAITAHMSPNPSHESGGSPQSHPEAYRSHSKPPTGTSSSQVAPASAPGVHSSLATPAKLHRKRHSKELPPGVKKPCSPDSTGSGGMVSGRVSSSDTVDATASRMADMQGYPPHGQQLQQSMAGFVYDPSIPIPVEVEWQMLSYQNQQKKKTGSDGKTGTEGMSVLSGQRPPSVPGSGPKDQPHHHHRHHSQRSHTGSDSARHQVKQELDPMTHHNKHHSLSNSHSHASLHTPNAAVLTPEQQARIWSHPLLMQSSSKRAEQSSPTSPSPAVIGHMATIMGSSPSGAIQVQGVHEAKESGRGESKLVDRHEASSIHRPPGRPRVRVPSHSTSATNRSPTEAKDKPQPHQSGLVAVAPPPVAGVQGMWPPEMMQYGGMLLSGYPAVGTSQASVGGAIPFSMMGAPQGVYSMSGGAWHINPMTAYGGAMEQKLEGSKAEHVPVVRATTTEPSKGHSTSNSRSSATASQSSSATGVQGRQEQQATPHSQGIFPFMMPGVRGGKDSPSPVPMSYLQGTGMHAYLQAQMQQQQQQQHHQQQHATAQQQRSETSSSRPISGLPSKSTSQEKSQQQQSVVSQQQKAVEQAAAAQQPLMAPGVMTQPLAVQMAGMIPMATQEDLAKFQLEYLQRNGMQQQEMMAFQQQMLHQMQQQFQQQQQQGRQEAEGRQKEGNSSDSSGSGSVAPSDRRKKSKHRQTQSREVLQRASPAPATSAGASNERSAARGFVYNPSMPIPVEWQMLAYQNQQKKKTGSDGKTGTEGMSVLSGQWPLSVPGSGPKDQPHHHYRHHSQRSHTGSDSARHQVKQELDPMTHHNKHHSSSNSHSRYAHETGTHRNTHGGHSHRDTYPMDYIEHRHEGKQGSATYGSDVAPHISTLASSSSSPSTHVVSSTKTASLPVAPLSAITAHMSPNPSHESGGSPQSHPEAYRSHSKPPTGTSSSQVAPASAPGVHSSLATPAKLHRKRHSKELPPGVKKPCSPDSTGSGGMVSGRVSSSDTVDATASRMADMQGYPPHGQQLQQSMAGFVYDPSMPVPLEWQMLSYQNQQRKKTGKKTGTEGMSVLSGQRPPNSHASQVCAHVRMCV